MYSKGGGMSASISLNTYNEIDPSIRSKILQFSSEGGDQPGPRSLSFQNLFKAKSRQYKKEITKESIKRK